MQSEKRKTIDSFFRSPKKKVPENEDIELNVICSSSDLVTSSSNKTGEPDFDASSSTSSSITVSNVSTSSCSTISVPADISKSRDDFPSQPQLKKYPVNDQKRAFQPIWFKDRPWLEYSVMSDRCYCFYCRHFSSNRLIGGDAFVTTGFNNWKRSLESNGGLTKHAACQGHIIAAKNYGSFKQCQVTHSNIINQLDSTRIVQIRRNRDRLTKICSTLHLLSRQMISFRGHVESEGCVI